jgi:transcriptional regulator with XRE-family HTH domain
MAKAKNKIQTVEFDSACFSETMQKYLKERNLSLREASKEIGVSASTTSRVMNGKVPDVISLYLFSYWMGINMEYFFKPVSPKKILKRIKKAKS